MKNLETQGTERTFRFARLKGSYTHSQHFVIHISQATSFCCLHVSTRLLNPLTEICARAWRYLTVPFSFGLVSKSSTYTSTQDEAALAAFIQKQKDDEYWSHQFVLQVTRVHLLCFISENCCLKIKKYGHGIGLCNLGLSFSG